MGEGGNWKYLMFVERFKNNSKYRKSHWPVNFICKKMQFYFYTTFLLPQMKRNKKKDFIYNLTVKLLDSYQDDLRCFSCFFSAGTTNTLRCHFEPPPRPATSTSSHSFIQTHTYLFIHPSLSPPLSPSVVKLLLHSSNFHLSPHVFTLLFFWVFTFFVCP